LVGCESQTVAALVPNANLYGENLQDAALVNQWTHTAETEFDAYLLWLWYICNGIYPYNKAVSLFRSSGKLEPTADLSLDRNLLVREDGAYA